MDNIEDCAFQHETIGGQYDVYSSWKYPTSPKSSSVPCDPDSDVTSCRRHDQRHRRRHWYLGVAKNGTLRTFISGSGHDAAITATAPRHRTMFVQRWISRLGSALGHLGPVPLTPSADPIELNAAQNQGGSGVQLSASSSKSAAGRRCSRLLRHCRRQRQQLPHRTPHEQPQRPQQHRLRHGNDNGDRKRQHQQLGLSSGKRRVKSDRSTTNPPDT